MAAMVVTPILCALYNNYISVTSTCMRAPASMHGFKMWPWILARLHNGDNCGLYPHWWCKCHIAIFSSKSFFSCAWTWT